MKNLISLFCVILFAAYSSGNSTFEKTISDFKQTEPRTGRYYDLHFKMLEMSQPGKIVVADSLKVLEADFRRENNRMTDYYKDCLSTTKKNLEREKNSRYSLPVMIGIHEKSIKEYEEKIAEFENG